MVCNIILQNPKHVYGGLMKIFLDDERIPVQSGWTVVRDSTEFVNVIEAHHDIIEAISFDHDLGNHTKSGAWCLNHLIGKMIDDENYCPGLEEIIFHSANVVGCENMLKTIESAVKYVPALLAVTATVQSALYSKDHAKMPDDFDYGKRDKDF